jgi:hypothetical protein
MSAEEPMLIPGLESENDATRIFALIDHLKDRQDVEFFKSIRHPWKVTFRGEPSLRHANRIALFREFLADKVGAQLLVAAGQQGSVAVSFTLADSDEAHYLELSSRIVHHPDVFRDIAQRLGITAIEFDGKRVEIKD